MTHEKKLNAFDAGAIEKAACLLKEGRIVAFPTETVYGLGADTFNPVAVAKVFEAKRRPQFDPLIVHVASIEGAKELWKEMPPIAKKLMEKFWPGPLTLVLLKKEKVPDIVTAGLSTVAVRMPDHKVALQLIRALGHPIAAPSANLFGYTSPTTAGAVFEDLKEKVDLILDAGPSQLGIESTVLKIEKDRVLLLRPGGINVEELEKFVRVERVDGGQKRNVYESPGQTDSHYAPWTNLSLISGSFEEFTVEIKAYYQLFKQKGALWPRIGLLLFEEKDLSCLEKDGHLFETAEILSSHRDLREAASKLFQSIRNLDKIHLDMIIAESLPESGLGLAIMDRLEKASAGHVRIKDFFNNLIN